MKCDSLLTHTIGHRNDKERDAITPLLKLWCVFFLYTCSMALLVQFVLLPHIFPTWHAGNGLLVGGDWLSFHRLAVDLAEKIHRQGWSAWELRPNGQAPAGIAGAIYALTLPQPWTLIPLNGALHATATAVFIRIVQVFVPNWRLAIWTVLPFLLYPSAMTWYTQIHKDGFFIAGAFLVIYGWTRLVRPGAWRSNRILPVTSMVYIVVGVFFIWIVRPYGVQMMQGISIIFSVVMTVIFLVRGKKGKLSWPVTVAACCLLWVMVVIMTPFTKGGIPIQTPKQTPIQTPKQTPIQTQVSWKVSEWLPTTIDNSFYSLAVIRNSFLEGYPNAGSNIDFGVRFHSAKEVIEYLPRAAQIAILSPFPNQWLAKGSLEANTVMRRVSAFETIGVYVALPFFCLAVWRWRRREELWCIMMFVFGMMLIYGITIPNIGTLYRARYGFLMIMVALGVARFVEVLQGVRRKQQTREDLVKTTA